MTEWREVSLGEATVSLDARRRPVKASDRAAGPYPYYGASGVVDYVDSWLFDETTLLVSEDGENLRTRKTPIAFLASGRYWVNNHAHVLKAAVGYDVRFLRYAVQMTDIVGYLTGSTQPKLTAANLANIRLRVPEYEEQRRIAAVLGAIDDLIETNRAQASMLEELGQRVAASAPSPVVLGQLARPVHSMQVRPTGTVEHYSLRAFDEGAAPERVDGERIQSNKLPLAEPCVLVSRLNPKWERCWMAYPGTNAVASTEFVPLVGRGVTPEEVWAVTSAPAFWEQMRTHVTGTTGSHQRVDKSAVLTLTVPDVRVLPESTRRHVQYVVRGARAARDEIADLTRARDELLPLIMSGKVRVSEDLAVG